MAFSQRINRLRVRISTGRNIDIICRHASSTVSQAPPESAIVHLASRRLLSISGPDAPRFLQGLTTNNVQPTGLDGLYTAFLNASGRLLHDGFVYRASCSRAFRSWLADHEASKDTDENAADSSERILLEIDQSQASALETHLRRHRLRSRVSIRPVDPHDWTVWVAWRKEDRWTPHAAADVLGSNGKGVDAQNETNLAADEIAATESKSDSDALIEQADGRAPAFARRMIIPAGTDIRVAAPEYSDLQSAGENAYMARRMLRGIAEGPSELVPGTALPLESNMDYMGGVDFRKGCYLGQELTIRTHHTGVVRKRILPVVLYRQGELPPTKLSFDGAILAPHELPPPGTEIFLVIPDGSSSPAKKSVGKWIRGIGNVGLAICRLEDMTDIQLTTVPSRWRPDQEFELRWPATMGAKEQMKIKVKAFVPSWHRGRGAASASLKNA